MKSPAVALLAGAVLGLLALSSDRSAPPTLVAPRTGVEPDKVAILLIDAQPSFWKIMHGPRDPVEKRVEQLLLFSDLHQIPVVATFEHDPKWNGWLPERLEKAFPEHGQRIIKKFFDCCREPEVRAALVKLKKTRPQIIVAGAETDVCVLQSCLGLVEMGFQVFLLEDCLFTHEPNIAPALTRLRAAGVVPSTYKTFYFEFVEQVARRTQSDAFKERRKRIGKAFISPYDLPPWRR